MTVEVLTETVRPKRELQQQCFAVFLPLGHGAWEFWVTHQDVTWDEARLTCESNGTNSGLVVIDSEEKLNQLKAQM